MNKLTTYICILSGVLLLFHFTGIIAVGEGSLLLDLVLNPTTLKDSGLGTTIEIAITGAIAAGVLVGSFATGRIEIALIGGVALFAWNLLTDLLVIYSKIIGVSEAFRPLALLILGVPILLLGIVVVDWWLGRG